MSKRLSIQFLGAALTALIGLLPQPALAGGDEGAVIKKRVYTQTSASGVSTDATPYHFAATIRNSIPNHTGTVLAPPASTYTPNPFTVVDPALLIGAHFVFDQGFADQASMDLTFPEAEYTFNIERTYASATTQFSQAVQFTGGAIPVAYPQITNSDWRDGVLWVQPSDARIFYTSASGVGFSWGLVGGGGSGGGSGSGAPGLLDLTGRLGFGQTYTGEFRFSRTESAYTVSDSNAGTNDYQKESTYSALKQSVVQFTLKTPSAPLGFSVLDATYTSNGQSWDVKSLLAGKIRDDAIIYRMDEWELTNNSPTGQDGSLYVRYENDEGVFEGTVTLVRNSWNSYLILPNPAHDIVPVSFSKWAKTYFTPTELYDISIWGLDRDPDGDGRSNLTEFAFGLNPRIAENAPFQDPKAGIFSDPSGYHYLVITFRRSLKAQVNFSVQQSIDFVAWPPLTGVETVEEIAGEPTVEKVSVRSSTPIEWVPKQFLRVSITDPNPAPTPPPTETLVILEATYGADGHFNDVKSILEASISNDALSLQVDNSTMGGDPIFGTPKELFVRFTYSGVEQTKTVQEGQTLEIP